VISKFNYESRCDKWFHLKCVKIDLNKATSDDYICDVCNNSKNIGFAKKKVKLNWNILYIQQY
jgi:hypothetical protein